MAALAASVIAQVDQGLYEAGYAHLPGLLTSKELADVRAALPPDAKPTGLDDPRLDCLWQHPVVLSIVRSVLGADFHLQGFDRRVSLIPDRPGRTCAAKLHTDWYRGAESTFYQGVAIFPLDPFRQNNGATRVVPGSHRWTEEEWNRVDTTQPHADEQRLIGKPGDAFILNAHVLHASGPNLTGSPRRAIFAFYVRNDAPQYNTLPYGISDSLRRRLSREANSLLR